MGTTKASPQPPTSPIPSPANSYDTQPLHTQHDHWHGHRVVRSPPPQSLAQNVGRYSLTRIELPRTISA